MLAPPENARACGAQCWSASKALVAKSAEQRIALIDAECQKKKAQAEACLEKRGVEVASRLQANNVWRIPGALPTSSTASSIGP